MIGWLQIHWRRRPAVAVLVPPAGPHSFGLLFVVATGFLILTAGYTSILTVQRQEALQNLSRYNVTWLLSQAAVEVPRLEATVGASILPNTTVDRDTVQLWLDIVHNRVQLLDSGEVREFIHSSPDLLAIDNEFRSVVAKVQLLVDASDWPGNGRLILGMLTRLNPSLVRLAAAAYERGSAQANLDLQELSYLHWVVSAVLAALFVCSFGLIAVLSWHNRLLRQSHQEVNGLITELKRSSAELSAANESVRQGMEEVQLQNQTLQTRDTERKRIEERLRLMVNELNHRVKNTLATVQAIALQTLRGADPAIRRTLEGRLLALASVYDVLTHENWEGADLDDVVNRELATHGEKLGRFRVSGPKLRLCPRAAQAIAMGLHELATNALKHGTLSVGSGHVVIRWDVTKDVVRLLRLTWTERGGPMVAPPTRLGFGTRMIERGLAQDLCGTVRISFDEPEGVTCLVEAPLTEVTASAAIVPFPRVGSAQGDRT
jgi:two-component sensor histidine kinase